MFIKHHCPAYFREVRVPAVVQWIKNLTGAAPVAVGGQGWISGKRGGLRGPALPHLQARVTALAGIKSLAWELP